MKDDKKGTSQIPTGWSFPAIDNLNLSARGVEKLLLKLAINKASGPDHLPNYYLRETTKQTAPKLAALFSQSLKTGVLPSDWLTDYVSIIFRKGDRHTASNYRHVSLTFVCCKVLEHIIVKHMLNHLDSHNILTDKQHGFRSRHSCEFQLIITIHGLLTSVDGGRCVDIGFFSRHSPRFPIIR